MWILVPFGLKLISTINSIILIFQVISISKDRRALVWDMKKLKKYAEMGWDPPNNTKYAYKRVR